MARPKGSFKQPREPDLAPVESDNDDPYVRLAAAMVLQAVFDFLSYVRASTRGKTLSRSELHDAVSAVMWLRGENLGGVRLKTAADAMHLDMQALYQVDYDSVVREMKARKSGRRRRED